MEASFQLDQLRRQASWRGIWPQTIGEGAFRQNGGYRGRIKDPRVTGNYMCGESPARLGQVRETRP